MLSEVYSRHARIRRNEVGEDFEFPAQNRSLRVVINGEIVSAQDFDTYDVTAVANIFVRYLVHLPEGWTATKLGKINQLLSFISFFKDCIFMCRLIFQQLWTVGTVQRPQS